MRKTKKNNSPHIQTVVRRGVSMPSAFFDTGFDSVRVRTLAKAEEDSLYLLEVKVLVPFFFSRGGQFPRSTSDSERLCFNSTMVCDLDRSFDLI